MQRYGQKTSKIPQKWGFSPISDPPIIFFKNRALSLLYPYGALISCKKLEKNNEESLRYLKRKDGPRTDKGDYYGPLQKNPRSNNQDHGKIKKDNIQYTMLSFKKKCVMLEQYLILKVDDTALQKIWKCTIDEYGHFLCFLVR